MAAAETHHQSDAADPVLDSDLVLRLARVHLPEAQAVTSVDETGGEARAYMVDEEVVFKTQRPHRERARTSLAKEAFFLRHLAASDPQIPVPRVLGYGRAQTVEYLVMTRMPGVALARAGLDPESRAVALRSAGQTLRRVHAVDQAPLNASGLLPGDTSAADLPDRASTSLGRLLPALAGQEGWPDKLRPETVVQQVLAATPTDTPPVALHSNPGPEHVFVDPATGAFSGLIDFGDAYRSHPAFDPRTWLSAEDSAELLAGYAQEEPLSSGFMRAWHIGRLILEATLGANGWTRPADAGEAIENILALLR